MKNKNIAYTNKNMGWQPYVVRVAQGGGGPRRWQQPREVAAAQGGSGNLRWHGSGLRR
jgi:hypothetical protein